MGDDGTRCEVVGKSKETGLTLTGAFELSVTGRRLDLPHSAERVLAYLALANRSVARSRLAGVLWLDGSDMNAAKCLRTALWRLRRAGAHVVSVTDDRLGLYPGVAVDVTELVGLATSLICGPEDRTLAQLSLLIEGVELLPDWDDEWVVADRERYRLLRLEALECAAAALIERHRLGEALIAALAAVQSEPLRESSRRLVVQLQLAQGNVAEAARSYREYRSLLQKELGLAPSHAMEELLGSLHRAVTAS